MGVILVTKYSPWELPHILTRLVLLCHDWVMGRVQVAAFWLAAASHVLRGDLGVTQQLLPSGAYAQLRELGTVVTAVATARAE